MYFRALLAGHFVVSNSELKECEESLASLLFHNRGRHLEPALKHVRGEHGGYCCVFKREEKKSLYLNYPSYYHLSPFFFSIPFQLFPDPLLSPHCFTSIDKCDNEERHLFTENV